MTASGEASAYSFMFPDDGAIPNNQTLPFLFYPRIFDHAAHHDAAATIEGVMRANGWGRFWRDGIYPFVHYHPRIHEALAVVRGRAAVRFGGKLGETFEIEAGDAAVLPAGTGHQCLDASENFLVVGGYPPEGIYDLCIGSSAEYERAVVRIPGVKRPETDPFFGADGPLIREWTLTHAP